MTLIFSVFTFQFVCSAGIIFNTRGVWGVWEAWGLWVKSPPYPRYPLSPQRSCRLKQAKNRAGIIFNTRDKQTVIAQCLAEPSEASRGMQGCANKERQHNPRDPSLRSG